LSNGFLADLRLLFGDFAFWGNFFINSSATFAISAVGYIIFMEKRRDFPFPLSKRGAGGD